MAKAVGGFRHARSRLGLALVGVVLAATIGWLSPAFAQDAGRPPEVPYIPIDLPGPPDCPEIGDFCEDGTQYAGRDSLTLHFVFVTPCPAAQVMGPEGHCEGELLVLPGHLPAEVRRAFEAQAQRTPALNNVPWSVLDYCRDLTLYGHADWVIPSPHHWQPVFAHLHRFQILSLPALHPVIGNKDLFARQIVDFYRRPILAHHLDENELAGFRWSIERVGASPPQRMPAPLPASDYATVMVPWFSPISQRPARLPVDVHLVTGDQADRTVSYSLSPATRRVPVLPGGYHASLEQALEGNMHEADHWDLTSVWWPSFERADLSSKPSYLSAPLQTLAHCIRIDQVTTH